MNRSRLLGLGIGVVLIVAALGMAFYQGAPLMNNAGAALAQAPATATPSSPNKTAPSVQGAVSDIANAFWNALAQRLGLSVSTLKSDVTDAQKAAIEQAVKDGKLTRTQADRMEQNLSSNGSFGPMLGDIGKGFERGAPRGAGGFLGGVTQLEAVANVLKLKPADLAAQLKNGKTLADITKAQNVDQTVVKQAIIDAEKAQLQREAQDGVITQAQADSMTANLTPDKIDLTRPMEWWGGARPNRPFTPGEKPSTPAPATSG